MGIAKVIVNGVTTMDVTQTTATADKILQGYGCIGADGEWIDGTATGGGSTPTLQSKTATPTTSQQTVSPDSGYDGLSQVTVNPIPSQYIVPTGTKSITENGTGIDVAQYASVDVAVPTGSTPSLQSKSVSYTPSETAQSATVTADSGYDGLSSVDVSVGAISATYVGSGVERHSSADAVADEESVVFPAGYYAEQHYGDVAIGTVSNQSLSVESVGHGEYAVRATVNVTEGYVPSSTKTDSLNLTDYLQLKTVTPTESQQSVSADDGKIGLYGVTVEAVPSTYVGSGITQRSSTDLTASGAMVTVPAGYYSAQASKAVASGTAGTPVITKGTPARGEMTIRASVTNTAGYISGGTLEATSVHVDASELVTGTYTIDSSGTHDVTFFAEASVPAGGATASATKGSVSNHSVTVTPSVTRTEGYVTAGTANGTAVTVSASELVSGSQTITDNGTVNVTNLASVTVDIDFVTYHTSTSEPTSSQGSDGDIWLVTA